MLQTPLTLPLTNKVCVYLLCILNTERCTGVGRWSSARTIHFLSRSNQACAVGAGCLKLGTRNAKQDVSGTQAQTSQSVSQSVSQSRMFFLLQLPSPLSMNFHMQ